MLPCLLFAAAGAELGGLLVPGGEPLAAWGRLPGISLLGQPLGNCQEDVVHIECRLKRGITDQHKQNNCVKCNDVFL